MNPVTKLDNFPHKWRDKTCADCLYFTDLPASTKNAILNKVVVKECRRHPPMILMAPVKASLGQPGIAPVPVYPQLPETFRACGDFEKEVSGS